MGGLPAVLAGGSLFWAVLVRPAAPASKGGVAALVAPADSAFSFFPAPYPPPTPFPSGEGGDQGYFMQGASPLASPGAEPLAALTVPAKTDTRRGAYLFSRLLTPPLACFSAPYPPDPLPQWGRGCPKVYFAGGFAPGTPALNRLRHVQTLPSRHPAGWRLFPTRIPAAPAGANALLNAQKPVFRKHSQCRAPPSLGDARGEAPCIRKQ